MCSDIKFCEKLFMRTDRQEEASSLSAIHPRCVRWVQVRSKDSQVKTQLVLWIFILFKVTSLQHVSASVIRPSSGHK